ncbi:MAG: hypothetical protein R6V44_01570, partial [Paracoccaceae bacterium]
REPRRVELLPGVTLQLAPLTTAAMTAAQTDAAVLGLPEGATDAETALSVAKALARRLVLDWDGIGDANGDPIPVSPEAVDALLDLWPAFEAFQAKVIAKALLLDAEKNASAPSPNGASAGATATAPRARGAARTAPKS